MKHTNLLFTAACAGLLSLAACQNQTEKPETTSEPVAETEWTIQPVGQSPEFPDASLDVKSIKTEAVGDDSVKITFLYDVQNYELKNQTADATEKGCANSKDGQHIHFILNNQPYVALYEPEHSFTVAKNSEHYVLSFLSRSYHEALKTPKASVLKHFTVDGNGKVNEKAAPTTPMVFYSRPKGDYLGKDTEKILFDFYVYQAELGKDAKIKAKINGKEFDIDVWQSYFIEGAPMGDLNIDLQLTDANGQNLSGDNTSVSRTSRLAREEPMN